MKLKYILLLVLLSSSTLLSAQMFEDVTPAGGIGTGANPFPVFGDIDNDGDADLITPSSDNLAIFFNDSGIFGRVLSFSEFKFTTNLFTPSIDLGDFNRDGQLDIYAMGSNGMKYLLENKNLMFRNLNQYTPNSFVCFFVDIDHDGDLDLAENGGVAFNTNNNATATGGMGGFLDPTFYMNIFNADDDPDLEFFHSAGMDYSTIGNFLYDQNGSSVEKTKQLNIEGKLVTTLFVDHDGDGDIDILAKDFATWKHKIYEFENQNYVFKGAEFPASTSVAWADVDSNGFPDVVLAGDDGAGAYEAKIYLNNSGTYVKATNTGLSGGQRSRIALADIDLDNDLDLAFIGASDIGVLTNLIYRNNANQTRQNLPPAAPTNLTETVSLNSVELNWEKATDDNTPNNSLTYNISLIKDDGTIIVASHSTSSGIRQIFKAGNANNLTTFKLSCLQDGTYHWSVQAIDAGMAGSQFASERTFTVSNTAPAAPTNLKATVLSERQIKLTWTDNTTKESEYVIYRRDVNDPSTDFSYPLMILPSNSTSFIDDIYPTASVQYEYKVVASSCAYYDSFSATVGIESLPIVFENVAWLDQENPDARISTLVDVDNDKDLDILLNILTPFDSQLKLYLFEESGYVESGLVFPTVVNYGIPAWTDLNNDGYLDLTVIVSESSEISVFMNNNGESFTETTLSIELNEVIWQNALIWEDTDHDGDVDLLLQAKSGGEWKIHLYKNMGNLTFQPVSLSSQKTFIASTSPWSDYDKDGDVDLLVTKEINCSTHMLGIYENNGRDSYTFKDLGLAGLYVDPINPGRSADMKWIDYDSDGFPDIVLSGRTSCNDLSIGIAKMYHNSKNKTFTAGSALSIAPPLREVQLEVGDYDNDGDPDLFSLGNSELVPSPIQVYTNNNPQFANSGIDYLLNTFRGSSVSLGDIDGDEDMDIVIAGEYLGRSKVIAYRNNMSEGWDRPNSKPDSPKNLKQSLKNDLLNLSWDAPADKETASAALTYEVYLTREDNTIINCHSHPDGTRKIVRAGNFQNSTSIKLAGLPSGTYRWSVQAIDAGFRGSAFATENTFDLDDLITDMEETLDNAVKLYPNPVLNGRVQMDIVDDYIGDVVIRISDPLGRTRVFNVEKTEYNWKGSFDCSNLNGLLVISINEGNRTYRKKVINR